MKKKILSLFLAMVLILGMIPTTVFAQGRAGITVYMTVFNEGKFCKTKDDEVMWQKAVTVTDLNGDGVYSLDEALAAAHVTYHKNGASAYGTEVGMYGTSVIKLWDISTYSTGFYRNNVMTAPVDQEKVSSGDKITAFIYADQTSWSDRYSFFDAEEKTVDVATEFSLKLSYAGYDASWNPTVLPVATAPIGVYDMTTGEYSVPTVLKGERIWGDIYMTPSTGADGTVKMQFTEIGRYYVTAQYDSANYSTYDSYMNSVPNYLVPPVCVVTVVDDEIRAVMDHIDGIGTVTEDSGSIIAAARNSFDALDAAKQKLVTNYDVLIASETAYQNILAGKEEQKKAEETMALIDAIGTVTENSGDAITAARNAYDALTDAQKTLVSNLSVLTEAESSYQAILDAKKDQTPADVKTIREQTANYLVNAMPEPTYGGEWAIIALARNGSEVPSDYYDTYYKNVEAYVQENIGDGDKLSSTRSTDNSRLIVALTAIGRNPQNVAGHNLLTPLCDFDYVTDQGLNGSVWALIALDTLDFEVPTVKLRMVQTTRDGLIQAILSEQLSGGGWTFSGNVADPDMTGMAIQALAPYYGTNTEVKTAVDKAVDVLSAMQQGDGGFASWGMASAESAAQVITALSAIGIDADADPRFVKNGNSAYDALLSYYAVGGGFKSAYDNQVNTYTTCQAFYAMAAYDRFKEGKASLYDMSDVKLPDQTGDMDNGNTQTPDSGNGASPKTGTMDGGLTLIILLACSAAGLAALATKKKKVF